MRSGAVLPAIAFAAACVLAAQSAAAELDVPTPYLPSTQLDVDEMLRAGGVGPKDMVVDLGSGDGRVVIAAAKYLGARGFGVDIDATLVALANENARTAGVADRVRFYQRDVFATDVREATVVTLYLLTSLVNRLRPKLLAELKPGTRIVAHDYGFEGWKPDRTVRIAKTFHVYIVPAQVAGKWRLEASLQGEERSYDFEINQQFQEIRGGARIAGGYLPLYEARLTGDRIGFAIADRQQSYHFEGRVSGSLMEGMVRTGIGNAQIESRWQATRVLPVAGEDK